MSSRHWLARGWVRVTLYLVAALLFVWLLSRHDANQVLSYLADIDPWTVVAAACLLVMVALFGAFNVFLLIGRDGRISFSRFLPTYWFSWAFGLLVPGQVGDIASLSWLLRRHALPASMSLGRAMLDKLISATVMLAVAVAGVAQLFISQPLWRDMLMTAVLAFSVLTAIVVYSLRRARQAGYDVRPGMLGAMIRTLQEVIDTLLAAPLLVMLNIGLTLIKLLLTGAAYWVVLRGLGAADPGLIEITLLATAAGLVAYLPLSVNGLGTVELAGVWLFGQAGIAAEPVLAAYILLRLLVLLAAWAPVSLWILFRPVSTRHAE